MTELRITSTSYLGKFALPILQANPHRHRFDPCPISGRCGVCGLRPDEHFARGGAA